MPIINYAELALKEQEDRELTRKALEKIIKNGQLAANMIENLLGFSRDRSETPEKVSLLHLVQDCFLCLVRDLEKDGIRVQVEISEDMKIFVIRNQIQQVLLNMIINARQAMLDKGGAFDHSGEYQSGTGMYHHFRYRKRDREKGY